jgi:digeranylgeranylglycerophospholipid reductase
VIGAGPSGGVAALYCAKAGLETVLVEKSKKIGGHIERKIDSSPDFGLREIIEELGLKTENYVRSSRWYAPSGKAFTFHSRVGEYYFKRGPEEDSFERNTVRKAIEEGCRLFLDTEVKGVARSERDFLQVMATRKGEEITFQPDVILVADGGNSFFHRGLRIEKRMILGYGVTGRDFGSTDLSEIYFDPVLLPGGYFFLITCRDGTSSGGIVLDSARIRETADHYYRVYLARNPPLAARLSNMENPFAGQGFFFELKKHRYGNLLLLGDAGGLMDPLMGYGMNPAISSGYAAGKYATMALEAGELALLEGYETEVSRRFCRPFPRLARRIFDVFRSEDVERIVFMAEEVGARVEIDDLLDWRFGALLRGVPEIVKNIPWIVSVLLRGIFYKR